MITSKDVEHVAKLARLALSEDEKRLYAQQLSRIIDYIDQLNKVDTTGVEPMSHALAVVNVMREDTIEAPPGHQSILASAPDREDAFFRVPKIGD